MQNNAKPIRTEIKGPKGISNPLEPSYYISLKNPFHKSLDVQGKVVQGFLEKDDLKILQNDSTVKGKMLWTFPRILN